MIRPFQCFDRAALTVLLVFAYLVVCSVSLANEEESGVQVDAAPGIQLLLQFDGDKLVERSLMAISKAPKVAETADGWSFVVLQDGLETGLASRVQMSPPADPSRLVTIRLAMPAVGMTGELRSADGRVVYREVFDGRALQRARSKAEQMQLKLTPKATASVDAQAVQRLHRQLQWQRQAVESDRDQAHADAPSPRLSAQLETLPDVDHNFTQTATEPGGVPMHPLSDSEWKDVDPSSLSSDWPDVYQDVFVDRPKGSALNGQLLDSSGAPVSHTRVIFWDSNRNFLGSYDSGADGQLQLDLLAGDYLISVHGPIPLVPLRFKPFTLAGQGFEIVMDIGVTLEITLRDQSGAPAAFMPLPWICAYPAWDQVAAMTYIDGACVNDNVGTFAQAIDRPYRIDVSDLPPSWFSVPFELTLSESTSMDVVVSQGRTVTVLGDGEEPLANLGLYIYEDLELIGFYWTNELGQFAVDLPDGEYGLNVDPPAPYLAWSRKQLLVEGPGDLIVDLPKGAVVDLDFGGVEPPQHGTICAVPQYDTGEYAGLGLTCINLIAAERSFVMRKDWPYQTTGSYLDPPWLMPPETIQFSDDGTYSVQLQRGVEVPVTVSAQNGSELDFHIYGQWPAGAYYAYRHGSVVLPQPHSPVLFEIAPHDLAYGHHTVPPAVYSPGDRIDLTFRKQGRLAGSVKGDDGQGIFAYVRAYKAGRYVAGTRTRADTGAYELNLPKQTYRIDVVPIVGRCCNLYLPPETLRNTQVGTETDLDIAIDNETVALNLNGPNQRRRVEVRQQETLLSVGYYFHSETPRIAPGVYDVTVETAGYRPKTFRDVDLTSDRTLTFGAGEPKTWTGTLKTATGEVMPHAFVATFDETQYPREQTFTNTVGRFEVPIGKDHSISFYHPKAGESLRSIRHIDRLASRSEDVVLDSLVFQAVTEDLSLIYTGGSPEPYKVIILAESYHANVETYVDENGNGVWDGVFFIDINENGVWDGEPVTWYGEADFPVDGEDPTLQNEPFDDLNGDGYLSFGGREVFEQNARAFVRDWLSADFWRDNQDKFDVYVYYQDSPDEGLDVVAADGQTLLLERDTLLGAQVELQRGLLSVDYTAATELAAAVLPDFDGIVVMINQPVRTGRANAFQLYNGGLNQPVNSNTPSHEYGHSIGFLADEYTEFPTNYVGPEPAAGHITKFFVEDLLPWDLDEGATLFSVPFSKGQGHFEGAFYHQGGVFRPSHFSTMNGSRNYFNRVSIDQLWENAPKVGSTKTFDGDFDGDGLDEWVLRDRRPDALLVGSHLQHGSISVGLSNAAWGPDWQIIGVGTVDGLNSEVMFARHQGTGKYRTFVVGEQLVASSPLAGLPTSSAMQAITIAHFDSDGQSDLLARNRSTGKWKLYLSGNGRWTDAGVLPFLFRSTAWRLAGHGDFNGDGIEDVVLRNANGKWKQYILNGSSFISKRNTNLPRNTQVQLVATGDFNGNGRDDVVLVDKQSGDFLVATSNTSGGIGRARTVSGLQGLANAWSVRGSGDYDGTGRDQILIRHKADGSWQAVSFEGGAAGRATLAPVDLPASGKYSH